MKISTKLILYFSIFISLLIIWTASLFFISYDSAVKRNKLIHISEINYKSEDISKTFLYTIITLTPQQYKNQMGYEVEDGNKLLLNHKVLIKSKKAENEYLLFTSPRETIINILIYTFLILILLMMQMIYIIFKLNNKYKVDGLIQLQSAEAKLASKNLSLLAENIHHELKTPLVVIVSKLDQIKEKLLGCKPECGVDVTLESDIKMIEIHVGVIYNLLDRMKNFKNLKRATDNKSIYEIIIVAFQTLELFSKNKFKYQIDHRLRNYMIYSSLRNEDLLNVFINHIKNSLEANATSFEVIMHMYHKNIVYLQLMDNGDGIPTEAINYIYVPNFSTKEINKNDGETRGIGLYLSKTTLKLCGGDDFLIETSPNGTSFGINIPSLRR